MGGLLMFYPDYKQQQKVKKYCHCHIYTYTPFYCGSMHILLLIYVDLPRLTMYFRIPGLVHHGVTQRG
jgi:hypothetical protein